MTESETELGALSRAEVLAEVAKLERTSDLLQFIMVHKMVEMYRRGEPVPDYSQPPDRRGRRRVITARS